MGYWGSYDSMHVGITQDRAVAWLDTKGERPQGTLMGPGAEAGAAVLNGKFKPGGRPSEGFGNILQDFLDSTVETKRMLKRIRDEGRRLEKLRGLSAKQRLLRDVLLDAVDDMSAWSDTKVEFLLCEVSKILTFSVALHKRYRRRLTSKHVSWAALGHRLYRSYPWYQ